MDLNHYYSRKDITAIVESVLTRPMNPAEMERFKEKIAYFEDPRYGYHIFKTADEVLDVLSDGNYCLLNFSGGVGVSARQGGGCYGYFADGLLESMVNGKLITASGAILPLGFKKLSEYLNDH